MGLPRFLQSRLICSIRLARLLPPCCFDTTNWTRLALQLSVEPSSQIHYQITYPVARQHSSFTMKLSTIASVVLMASANQSTVAHANNNHLRGGAAADSSNHPRNLGLIDNLVEKFTGNKDNDHRETYSYQ